MVLQQIKVSSRQTIGIGHLLVFRSSNHVSASKPQRNLLAALAAGRRDQKSSRALYFQLLRRISKCLLKLKLAITMCGRSRTQLCSDSSVWNACACVPSTRALLFDSTDPHVNTTLDITPAHTESLRKAIRMSAKAMQSSFCKSRGNFQNPVKDSHLLLQQRTQSFMNPLIWIQNNGQHEESLVDFFLLSTKIVDIVYEPKREGIFGMFADSINYSPESKFLRQMGPYGIPPSYQPRLKKTDLFMMALDEI